MGYETVRADSGAIAAAARLAAAPASGPTPDLVATLPLLVDQVAGEAGVWEPAVCARALTQARGDVARAVSLVRAWAAMLPRLDHARVPLDGLRTLRRITPAFREPDGGQYLGASQDYAQRLLDFDSVPPVAANGSHANGSAVDGSAANGDDGGRSHTDGTDRSDVDVAAAPPLPRALQGLHREGLLDTGAPARADDVTRAPTQADRERGAFDQLLARGETGALTALAYASIRGTDAAATLAELRTGELDVRVTHPVTGASVRVGAVPVTLAEMVLYGGRQKADGQLGLGIGATLGRVERRAISAAVLDANCAVRNRDPSVAPSPSEDQEFLQIALDGQEATGFVEHLKLPHHVTFTSVLDRLAAGPGAADHDPEEDV